MAKKSTLNDIAALLTKQGVEIKDLATGVAGLETTMEKGFAAVADDIARVQDQVNSIEAQLRLGRYETRLGKLEEKVFGAPRR